MTNPDEIQIPKVVYGVVVMLCRSGCWRKEVDFQLGKSSQEA